ncbi:enoyl-CoA hydratase/isomerase family protein [Bacillus spongiae]|uniref:Enoyl-CoA hydratase/isomerase family protein n=1 Tax=Bacillus spongiae TaxID=2683610 RepID=A0ABU8H9U5_9BACI
MGDYIIEKKGHIVCFTINREKKRNAVNDEVMNGLQRALEEAKHPTIKALLIKGAGVEAFCSGGDLSVFHKLFTAEEAFGMLSKMGKILYTLSTFEKPTFCYINGLAVGGGAEIATACDIRVIQKSGRVGFIQGALGITTGWGGGTLLMKKLQRDMALQMLLSSSRYDADSLKNMGFVREIVDSERAAIEYFTALTHHSLDVMMAYKKMMLEDANNLFESMKKEIEHCSVLWATKEHHQAVASFLQKK